MRGKHADRGTLLLSIRNFVLLMAAFVGVFAVVMLAAFAALWLGLKAIPVK